MRLFTVFILSMALWACSRPASLLERVKEAGELIVITRNSPTTYYEDAEGLTGLEYDLVEMFAARLGVRARYLVPDRFEAILPMISRGEGHLAAAGLTITPARESLVRFGPSYQQITQQLIYRRGNPKPRDIRDTVGGTLEIMAGTSHEEELIRLKQKHPELNWEAQRDLESEELLHLVNEQIIDFTIADSNEVALNRRYYPALRVAFDLTAAQKLAWAFAHAEDSSLYEAARKFFDQISKDGSLNQLLERHYGHVERLNFVDKRTFRRHVVQRLPQYVDFFKKAEQETGLDWRLLAAISYQESHWNPRAVSPTGVRGMMMLTQATAKQLGVDERLDPEQSILGGAGYVRLIEGKIPERILEPDRLWLALAGYNVGFAHLEDARILTQRSGADPDKWADVKRHLPLLSQKKWHKTVRHGYARGREPVNYVDNIRSYYDLLLWLTSERKEKPKDAPNPLNIAPPVL